MKARVSYSTTRTINLGNYESVKVQAGLEVQCDTLDKEETYNEIKEWVDGKIEEETYKWQTG
jgi:hypothetical protein